MIAALNDTNKKNHVNCKINFVAYLQKCVYMVFCRVFRVGGIGAISDPLCQGNSASPAENQPLSKVVRSR